MTTNFLILVCERCDSSFRVKRGDLPARCPACRQRGHWRIALAWELTKSDHRWLKSLHIDPEDDPPPVA